tara:strand:- start:713 stop:2032 length:1320 start_codon:yes stop_codon:yes gene_type:complete
MAEQTLTGEEDKATGGKYPWYALGVLILAYTFSYLDRQALTLMVEPIRNSLDISDTQLSLLHGFAFAIFYTILGVPLGRLVDQYRRTTIVAGGIVVWSVMTALCGTAKNFGHMFLARVGVGVGEAALSPGAYSLISDYFPPNRLPQAMSLYLSAIYIGSGFATIVGGTLIMMMPAITLPILGQIEPWQGVFIAIGLPGILVALWVVTLREPKRRGTKKGVAPSVGAMFGHMVANKRAYGLLIMGYAIFTLFWNGGIAWFPTLLMRVHGWTPAEVGIRYGLVIMIFGTAGVILGGMFASWLRRRGRTDSNILAGILAAFVAVPAGIAGGYADTGWNVIAAVAVFQFGCAMPFGAAAAALQEITPNQMRGQVTAIYLFTTNMFGIGLGPTLVALATDQLYNNDMAIGSSISTIAMFAGPLSVLLLYLALKPYREAFAKVDF